MTALDTFLVSQATEARARELVDTALAGRPLTSDECDVLRGLVSRCFDYPDELPPKGATLDRVMEAISSAIDDIDSLSSYRLETALDILRKFKKGDS